MENEVLKKSIAGISREINLREWMMSDLIRRFYGDEDRFIKEPIDKTGIIKRGLKLFREIRKLKMIRAELHLIVQLNEFYGKGKNWKGLEYSFESR
jgi:hypothetical protein